MPESQTTWGFRMKTVLKPVHWFTFTYFHQSFLHFWSASSWLCMGHMMTQLVSLQVPPLCRHQAKVPTDSFKLTVNFQVPKFKEWNLKMKMKVGKEYVPENSRNAPQNIPGRKFFYMFLAILRWWPFWDGEFTWPELKGDISNLQRSGIKRSRIESPGTFTINSW